MIGPNDLWCATGQCDYIYIYITIYETVSVSYIIECCRLNTIICTENHFLCYGCVNGSIIYKIYKKSMLNYIVFNQNKSKLQYFFTYFQNAVSREIFGV